MNGRQDARYRLFVAIRVPERVKDQMERAQLELRRALLNARVSWVGRAQFHVTLKFLGSVDRTEVDAIGRALESAGKRFYPLPLDAIGVLAFPERRPRVMCVPVLETHPRLASLHSAVEEATAEFTSEAPERSFKGHITLGRLRTTGRQVVGLASTIARTMETRRFGSWTAEAIELVRSELGPGGSRYTTLAAIPLSARSDTSGGS